MSIVGTFIYLDGTAATKRWLKQAVDEVRRLITKSVSVQGEAKQDQQVRPMPKVSNSLVLTHAYLKLLEWKDEILYPEVFLAYVVCIHSLSLFFSFLIEAFFCPLRITLLCQYTTSFDPLCLFQPNH